MVVQQSVGRHDTESSRTADCFERIVSDELMVQYCNCRCSDLMHAALLCCYVCFRLLVICVVTSDRFFCYQVTLRLISSAECRLLSDNQLDGTIPSQVGRLTALERL